MTYVITARCIRDGSCAEVCPVECIVDGGEEEGSYFIDPETCIDCGACEPECPEDAIFYEDEVPDEYQEAIAKNRAWFEEGPGYG